MPAAAAARKSEVRQMPPLMMRAAIEPSTLDAEDRSVDVVFTTGAAVLRFDYERMEHFWEELSTDARHVRLGRLNNGAPVLDAHQQWDLRSVIGVVKAGTAKMDGKAGTARLRFSKRNADMDGIWSDVKDGILGNVSIGYRVYRFEELGPGDRGFMRRRAIDWEPHEVSFVPIGADDGAGTRAADPKVETNPCEIINRAASAQTETTMTPEQIAQLRALARARNITDATVDSLVARHGTDFDAARAEIERTPVPAAGPSPSQVAATAEQARAAERERSAAIYQAVRGVRAGVLPAEFAEEHIRAGTSPDAVRAVILEKLNAADAAAPTRGAFGGITAGEDARDKFVRGASDWLLIRAGQRDTIEKAEKRTLDPGEFRGMSLMDLARDCVERAGIKTRGMDKMTIAGTALTLALYQRNAGGFNGTSDFAVLLENVMHKTLLGAYATTPDTWRAFCAVGSVSDFRAHNRYRLGSFGTLDALDEHGEFKNKAIPDGEKTTITATTKGNIIALTRQAIVNDDIGAFTSLAARFGRAAGLSVESDVYALLALNSGLGPTQANSQPLFHSSRANVGTASAIAAAALDADSAVMAVQTDPSGNEILDLKPAVLLVPRGLLGQANVINESQYDPDTVANKSQMKPNVARGMFTTVVGTGRLSGTRRYLFASPSVAPVIEVAFLDGQQSPFMEVQNGWRIDGVEWKVRLDYGVAAVDYRGAVTNAGAP